ncbi:MAG: metal ABC transporter ATP-binding protein [SAR202 cluster bacterium]|nr:metal ABC transporter ATP-binding protein [SAR202 cluster bacterium]
MLQKTSNDNCQIVSDGCCVELGNEVILDDVSFSIKKGTLVGVVGPNGGGKTTLFNTILGLVSITHGSIKIKGLDPKQTSGMIGYVPQKEELNWNFPVTAKEVVQMGITNNNSLRPIPSKKDHQIIEESLSKVDLLDRINDRVENMSGGQRQRVFLARTLAQGAEILLLDEAFSGVDIGSQEKLLDVLKKLKNDGNTVLMATHDLNTIGERFDEVLCLNRHCCAFGDPKQVLTKNVLAELYGSHSSMFENHSLGNHGHNDGI